MKFRSPRLKHKIARTRSSLGSNERPGPSLKYSVAQEQVKGEDVVFVVEDLAEIHHGRFGLAKWSVYCVCDGHGGTRAAKFVRSQLGPTLSQLLPTGEPPPYDRPEGIRFAEEVRRALLDAFLSLSEAFMFEGCRSAGTTVSVALVCGWMLTIANVGDSEVFLDARKTLVEMTCCHKLNDNTVEQGRLVDAGLQVNTLSPSKCGPPKEGEVGIGPLRVWPGGIAMSRSLGDIDCGPHILPVPHVRQIIIPATGARLIMASDGLWDHLSGKKACKIARTCQLHRAPQRLIHSAMSNSRGSLSDDTSVLVLDMLPSNHHDFAELSTRNDVLPRRVVGSFKKFVRKTVWRHRGHRRGGLYADVDCLVDYSHVMEISNGRDAPLAGTSSSEIRSSSGGGGGGRRSNSVSKSNGGSDSWDLCHCSWECSADVVNVWEKDERDILDSAQNYVNSETRSSGKRGPKIKVTLIREGTNKMSGESLDVALSSHFQET